MSKEKAAMRKARASRREAEDSPTPPEKVYYFIELEQITTTRRMVRVEATGEDDARVYALALAGTVFEPHYMVKEANKVTGVGFNPGGARGFGSGMALAE